MIDLKKRIYAKEVRPENDGLRGVFAGWVKDIRDLGSLEFLVIEDVSGDAQVTFFKKQLPDEVLERLEKLKKQYVIAVEGVVKKSEKAKRGVEIIAENLEILSEAKHPLPLDPTGRVKADLDTRLKARTLDLRRKENRAIFRIQHILLQGMREELCKKGFIEVFTPKLISTATEGGAQLFQVDYFGRKAFLAQSPQLYKERLTSAFEKVFEVGVYFRAEEFHTRRHLCEFVSVDVEQAFADWRSVMDILEDVVIAGISAVRDKCKSELETLGVELKVPRKPFPRYTYDEIFDELKSEGAEVEWGEDFPTPALRILEKLHPGFYFIEKWPKSAKPFYIKECEEDPKYCEAFDLMGGWIEIASGGTRVHRRDELERRLQEQGLNPADFEDHLRAFDCGMPPHAGWGLGLARLMMYLLRINNIREVVLYPRDKERLRP